MKPWPLLLLAACGGAPEKPAVDCNPPAFDSLRCFVPGGGVTRCHEPDDTWWDKEPDGTVFHWIDIGNGRYQILCEVPHG